MCYSACKCIWYASMTVLSLKLQTHTDVHFEMRNAASPLWEDVLIHLIHGADSAIHGKIHSKSDLPSATLICRYYSSVKAAKCLKSVTVKNLTDCFFESDYGVFKFSLSWSDPHHSSPPITLIRHSHTHIKLVPFLLHTLNGWLQFKAPQKQLCKTSSFRSQGILSENSTHITTTAPNAIQKTLWNLKWHCAR